MSNALSLIDLIRADAAWVAASGFTIECDSARSTVSAENGNRPDEFVFMQGQEADEFNDEAERLWNETQETTIDECRAHLIRQYIETLFG